MVSDIYIIVNTPILHEEYPCTYCARVFFFCILKLVIDMYEYYNPNPDKTVSASDCVVRAITKALDVSWDTAYLMLSIQGYIDHEIFASDRVWNQMLFDMGYKRKAIPDTCPICYRIADFAADNSEGTFILGTGKHAVCVKNGVIYDVFDSSGEIPIFYFDMTKENRYGV